MDSHIGKTVQTSDGKAIGMVTAEEGGYVRVEHGDSERESYWLPADRLMASTLDTAAFNFPWDTLEVYAEQSPPIQADVPHEERGPLLPDETSQRITMLKELAAQRDAMRQSDEALPDAERSVGEPVEQELSRLT